MVSLQVFLEAHLPRFFGDEEKRKQIAATLTEGPGSMIRTVFDLGVEWGRTQSAKVQIGESDLERLMTDRDYYQRRVTELQEEMNKHVDRSLARQVRAFHLKFGHPVRTTPTIPNDDEMRFRLKLITEEYLELLAACGIGDTELEEPSGYGSGSMSAADIIRGAIANAPIKVNLPEFIDACGDLDFVVEGGRTVTGVDGYGVRCEISRANLEKDPVYVSAKDDHHMTPNPTAKPTKPAGWKPPNILGELVKQGWTG